MRTIAPLSQRARASASGLWTALLAALAVAALSLPAAAQDGAQRTAAAPATPLVAADTIRPGVILTERHIARGGTPAQPGEVTELANAVGFETRIAIYRGRPIRHVDLGPPTLVRRNDIVRLSFAMGGLSLATEGRALDDGGLGERIRVMNLDSRRTVFGVVSGMARVEARR